MNGESMKSKRSFLSSRYFCLFGSRRRLSRPSSIISTTAVSDNAFLTWFHRQKDSSPQSLSAHPAITVYLCLRPRGTNPGDISPIFGQECVPDGYSCDHTFHLQHSTAHKSRTNLLYKRSELYRNLLMGKIPWDKNKFLGTKNKLWL